MTLRTARNIPCNIFVGHIIYTVSTSLNNSSAGFVRHKKHSLDLFSLSIWNAL
jgi:hypothetical protein